MPAKVKKIKKTKVSVAKPKTKIKPKDKVKIVSKSNKPKIKAEIVKPKTKPKPKVKVKLKNTKVNVRLVEKLPSKDVVEADTSTSISTDKEIVESVIKEEEYIAPIKKQEDISNFEPTENEELEPEDIEIDGSSEKEDDIFDKSEEVRQDNYNTGEIKHKNVSLGFYRKIAYGFIFFTVSLLAVIFYFSFVKVSIIVTPKQERISDSLIVDIYDNDEYVAGGNNSVVGVVKQIEIEQTKTYKTSGQEIIGEEAFGKVNIINNYSKNQPLVATTRLLSSDNKLFRIRNTVNVPAGKSVEVEIYADDPSSKMAIGPSKFTIPGLWAGLQDKIYAESKEPIEYKQRIKKFITQSDINNSVEDAKNSLLIKAKNDIDGDYISYDQVIYDIDNNSVDVEIEGKINDEKEEFSVTVRAFVIVVAFSDDSIFEIARNKLISRISDNKELSGFSKNNILYNLDSYSVERGTAVINTEFEGLMSFKEDADIIDKSMLPGLNKAQLVEFLDSKTDIIDYKINFSPSFINKVPNLVDRIDVSIEKSSFSGE